MEAVLAASKPLDQRASCLHPSPSTKEPPAIRTPAPRPRSHQPPAPQPLSQACPRSLMKLTVSLPVLLCWSTLWWLREATAAQAPVPALPHRFLLQCLEQVRKIQAQSWELQEKLCASYQLCHPEELVLLGHSLGIPRARPSSCSNKALQLTSCLGPLHRGLFLYQGLLQALAGITPELEPTVDLLQLDVADFATNVWRQMEDMGVAPSMQPAPGPMPTFTSAFQRRAGGVLVASSLQTFLEQASRLLRGLTQP
ncbi:granulocyte colony-stimulating factor [Sorex fumeus]|uniref:granulocyte colony-stimulating factor n=1 Tax=Sorex fumeus TaxID=62283 RepID=UPI0024ACB132|nr:granulocyte colony-stimulating factor [Sorex fumeus]